MSKKHSAKKVGVTAPAQTQSSKRSGAKQNLDASSKQSSQHGITDTMASAGEGVMKYVSDAAKQVSETTRSVVGSAGEYAKTAEKSLVKAGGAVAKASGAVAGHVSSNPIPYALMGVGAAWLALSSFKGSRDFLTDAAGWTSGHARSFIDGAGEQTRGIADASSKRAKELSKGVTSAFEEHPLAFGAAVLAASAAIALAIPRTKGEDSLIGATTDKFKERVSTLSHDTMEKAQDVAERLFDAGSTLFSDSSSKRSRTASA